MTDRRELSLGIMFTGHMDATLRSTLDTLRTRMANMAGATTRTGAAAAGAAPKVKRMGDEFSQVGKQLSRVEGGVQRLLAAFKVVAAYGVAGTLTFGLIQSIKEGVSTIFEFDQALYNLKAIANASEAELQAMGNAIFDVAETTKFSASEVGDAMVLLAQAGFTAAESVDAIGAVAKLATGTLSDLKTSSDLLTTVIRAFGLEATEAGRIADVMANAVNRSKLTVDKLRVAFNYIGPVANKVGLSIEETAASTMVLANAGIRASTIGTGLRQVLARLKAPNEKLREAFIAAGADLSKFTGKTLNMREVMGELVKIVPDATRAFELFGLRGAPAVSALTEAGVKGFDDMYDAVLRAGEATRMAETQMEGLVVMAKNLRDRLGTLAIRLGEGGIAGAFEVFIRGARILVKVLSDLAEKWYVQVIVGTTTLSSIILLAAGAFKFLTFAITSLTAGLAASLIPIGVSITLWKQAVLTVGALTVAIDALKVALLAHPFFLVASAISLVVAGLAIWIRSSKKALLQLEAEERAATKNAETLERYKKELDKLIPGTKEYGAVLRRLGADFEEMRKYIDNASNSFKDHGEALDALIEKKADVALEKLVGQLRDYTKELEILKKLELYPDVEMPEIISADTPDILVDTAAAAGKVEDVIERLPEIFKLLGFTVDSSVADIRAKLEKMIEGKDLDKYLDDMVSAVVIGLIRIKYEMEKAVPDMKSLLAEVPDYWKETFKSLDAEGQSYFVQSLSRIDKEIAAFDKRTKELRLDEDQLAAARTAIRLKGMREFVENNYEEIKSARERRILLERMEESFRAHKKELYEKGLADIRIFTDEDIRQAQRSAANKEEYEQKLAKITKDRAEQKLALDKKYAGEMAAIDNVQLRRRIADEKEYQEEVVKIRQRYARLMATLETDPAKKLKAEYEARIGVIRSNLARELSAALDNKDKIVEAEVKAHNAMMKAWRTYIFDKGKLEQEKTEETLKLEASQLELRLESMRSAAAEQYETSETFKMKELELEEQLLLKYNALAAKRYELNKSLLGEEHKETIKSKRELQDTLIDLERNYGDQRRLQEKTRLKGLEKDTQEYLENRILQMKRQGATEEEIERTRWEHMAEYSDSWLKRIRAGLGLATLDFREASRDWAGLVQDMADQASASLGEFFYGVMKDSKDLSDVWKNMLDAMLRYLADFMAKKAVLDFLAMIGQIASGYAGGGAGTGAKPESGAYHSGPLYQAHRGGEVGVDIMPRRFAPDWLFNLAPRLHTGLRPDEFPAILQRGEEVVPRGERDGGVRTVNIFTPDTRTMAEWVRRNRGVFASATIDTIKDGDRGLIGAIRSVSRG